MFINFCFTLLETFLGRKTQGYYFLESVYNIPPFRLKSINVRRAIAYEIICNRARSIMSCSYVMDLLKA